MHSPLRIALSSNLAQRESDLAWTKAEVAAIVERRKALAARLNLTERLFEIYEELRFYPSWAVNCPEELCPAVGDVDAPQDHGDELDVTFGLTGTPYSFSYRGRWTTFPDGDASYYADLSLNESTGKVLYTLWLERGDFGTRFIDTKAFVPGGWMSDFLELSERIAIVKRERQLRVEGRQRKEQRANYGLEQNEEIARLTADFGVGMQPDAKGSAAARRAGSWLG